MEDCSICLDKMNDESISTINCNHSFCNVCIEEYINKNKNTCPLCRCEIKEFYNKEERTKIIFKNSPQIVDPRVIRVYELRYHKMCLKAYLLLIIIFIQFYLLLRNSYYLDRCEYMNNEYHNNNTLLLNNYNSCVEENELESRTEGTYIYSGVRKALVFCQLTIFYLSKCLT